jgi:glycosyltransferase involved in cell wall biosynthesis
MHVAIITTEYQPYNNVGGIATFTSSLAQLLVKNGHKVFVLTDINRSSKHGKMQKHVVIVPFVDVIGVRIIRRLRLSFIGKLSVSFLNKFFPSTTQVVWLNILAFLTFLSLRRREDVDIIHTPVLFAAAYLISFVYPRVPLITHAQGPDELLRLYDYVTFDTKLKAQLETAYMKRSRVIIPCSQSVRKYLNTKHRNIRHKLLYIPNFINTKEFRASSAVPDVNNLLFIGRMEYRKGPDLVIKSFIELSQRYPKLTLTFIGEDTNAWIVNGASVKFSRYVKSFRLPTSIQRKISFIPRIDQRSRLIKYITAHRGIAVLPSRYEPFGYVFLETMMTGSITIASKEGGGTEIIHNGVDGFTINPTIEDIITSVHKIQHLKKQRLTNMIESAKDKICNTYDISSVADSYKSLYHQIIASRAL